MAEQQQTDTETKTQTTVLTNRRSSSLSQQIWSSVHTSFHSFISSDDNVNDNKFNTNNDNDNEENKYENSEKPLRIRTSQILASVFKQINDEKMLSNIFDQKHWNNMKYWSTIAHNINIAYPEPKHLPFIDDSKLQKQLQYAIRYAVAAYFPHLLWATLCNANSYAVKKRKHLIHDSFGIEYKDIIIDYKGDSSKYHSSHLLCIDHANQTIVLAIRGTQCVSDVISDLDCDGQWIEFDDGLRGFVHRGIYMSAKWLYDRIINVLINVCNKCPTYQLIITGHSLGAGIASFMGLMLRNNQIIRKGNNLRVYSFASPCIASKKLLSTIKDSDQNEYIHSIALSTDMVTRLSLQSIKKLHKRLDIIKKFETHIKKGVMDNPWMESELMSVEFDNKNMELFPVGRVLWFVPRTHFVNNDSADNDKYKKSPEMSQINSWEDFMSVAKDKLDKVKDSVTLNTTQLRKKYDAPHWILCDATKQRRIFQEYLFDFHESWHAHMPYRYLWALNQYHL